MKIRKETLNYDKKKTKNSAVAVLSFLNRNKKIKRIKLYILNTDSEISSTNVSYPLGMEISHAVGSYIYDQ
jgi:hypothetical protein